MAQLALKAVLIGAEKIPDEVFHAIPGGYFRPAEAEAEKQKRRDRKRREKQRRKHERKESGRQPPYSSSSSSDSDDQQRLGHQWDSKKKPQRRRPRPQHRRGSSYIDREYESDRGPIPADDWQTYFPPPPTHAVEDSADEYYKTLKPYHPADYAQMSGKKNEEYRNRRSQYEPDDAKTHREPMQKNQSSHRAELEKSYAPRQAATGDIGSGYPYHAPEYDPLFPAHNRNSSQSRSQEHSTSHARANQTGSSHYTPGKYIPSAYNPPQPSAYTPSTNDAASPEQVPAAFAPPPTQPIRDVAEPSPTATSTVLAPYQPPSENSLPIRSAYPSAPVIYTGQPPSAAYNPQPTSTSQSPPGSRERSHHRRSRSRRSSGLRESLKEHKDMGAAALGAVAGGLVGRQMGHGSGLSTLVGAAVGGFGSTYAEKKIENERRHRQRRRGEHHVKRNRSYEDGYDSY